MEEEYIPPTVMCINCTWKGREEDLQILVDASQKHIEYIKGCPNCKTDEYLMDL